jgi:hypothetical protein
MDDFPKEFPRVWVAAGIFLAAITLAFFMLVYTSIQAHAQQQKCAALSATIEDLGSKLGQRIVWEGTIPTPSGVPVEAMLFQSPKGSWTMMAVQGVAACFMAAGENGTPIETGRGV